MSSMKFADQATAFSEGSRHVTAEIELLLIRGLVSIQQDQRDDTGGKNI